MRSRRLAARAAPHAAAIVALPARRSAAELAIGLGHMPTMLFTMQARRWA
jgi:hypothetical protein